jgi:hypothetical protein
MEDCPGMTSTSEGSINVDATSPWLEGIHGFLQQDRGMTFCGHGA